MEIRQDHTVRNTAIAATTGAVVIGGTNLLIQNVIKKQPAALWNRATDQFYKSIEQGASRDKAQKIFDSVSKVINSIAQNGINFKAALKNATKGAAIAATVYLAVKGVASIFHKNETQPTEKAE